MHGNGDGSTSDAALQGIARGTAVRPAHPCDAAEVIGPIWQAASNTGKGADTECFVARFAPADSDEDLLLDQRKHVLVAYDMKPLKGYDYQEAAVLYMAGLCLPREWSVEDLEEQEVDEDRLTDPFVYYIDPEKERMNIAFHVALFEEGRLDSVPLAPPIKGKSACAFEHARVRGIYFPPEYSEFGKGNEVGDDDREASGNGPLFDLVFEAASQLSRKGIGITVHQLKGKFKMLIDECTRFWIDLNVFCMEGQYVVTVADTADQG